jgi:hypothetical protein
MKTLPLAFLLFLSIVCATPLAAQTFIDLKELKQVKIVIEELDVDADRAGITRGAIESQTIAALKQDMPKVEVKDSAVSYVYLRVITSFRDNWCAVRVVIQVWRPVMVLRDDGEPVAATLANVGERGTTLTGPGRTMGPKVLQDDKDIWETWKYYPPPERGSLRYRQTLLGNVARDIASRTLLLWTLRVPRWPSCSDALKQKTTGTSRRYWKTVSI